MEAAWEASDGGATTKKEAGPIGWPPAVAERYRHAVLVGRGMFGKVYVAWDSEEIQLVAVKQLSGTTDGEVVKTGPREFEQEVAAIEACRGHPNVVQLVDAVGHQDEDGTRFIVTQFAGAENLQRYLPRRIREDRPAFSEAEVRDAMAQLLSGLAHAHEAGIVHREVVPDNVIVDDEPDHPPPLQRIENNNKKKTTMYKYNKYTICGFNASEPAGQPAKDGSAQTASSRPYRAPELFLGSGVTYDERIDTWGLGCIMAELVAGTDGPFFSTGSSSDAEALKQVLQVVGGKGLAEWSGLRREELPPEASKVLEEYSRDTGRLRAEIPNKKLSQAGFDVLCGLLQSNPDRRLTAAAALKMPWFRPRGRGLGTFFT